MPFIRLMAENSELVPRPVLGLEWDEKADARVLAGRANGTAAILGGHSSFGFRPRLKELQREIKVAFLDRFAK